MCLCSLLHNVCTKPCMCLCKLLHNVCIKPCVHLCKLLHNAWGWTNPVLWYPLGQNLAILKKKTYEKVWVCGTLTLVSSKLLLSFKFYFWLFWGQISLCGIGWPWNNNPAMSSDLPTFCTFSQVWMRHQVCFLLPQNSQDQFSLSPALNLSLFSYYNFFIEIQNSSLLWSCHFGDWVSGYSLSHFLSSILHSVSRAPTSDSLCSALWRIHLSQVCVSYSLLPQCQG